MTTEEIAIKYGLCSCDEAYTKRGLTAPDCPWHAFAIEEAMEEYAALKISESQKWIKIDSEADLPKKGGDYWVVGRYDKSILLKKYAVERIRIFGKGVWLDNYSHYMPITEPQLPKD